MSQSTESSRREMAKESTRRAIVDASLKRFGSEGYSGALIGAIASDAGVTTGAIYHHFGGKKELFFAAALALESDVLDAATKAAAKISAEDPWLALEHSLLASLEMCARPSVARILFQEAPSIIGAAEWRVVQQQFALGAMTAFFYHLEQRGDLSAPSIPMLAHMLIGAMIEGANAVASSKDMKNALMEAIETIKFLVKGIRLVRPIVVQ